MMFCHVCQREHATVEAGGTTLVACPHAARDMPIAIDTRPLDASPSVPWVDFDEGFTLSDRPDRPGWRTDGGHKDCGLPENIAEAIAEIVNAAKEL